MSDKSATIQPKANYDGSTPLRSAMQEMVLDKILAGAFQTDAYIEVYHTSKSKRAAEAAASRLLSKGIVKARLDYKRAELGAKVSEKLEITRENQAKLYDDVRQRAKEDGDVTNEIRALNSIDKLFGLSIDKTEITEPQPELMAEEREKYRKYARWRMEQDSIQNSNNMSSLGESEAEQEEVPSLSGQNQG